MEIYVGIYIRHAVSSRPKALENDKIVFTRGVCLN